MVTWLISIILIKRLEVRFLAQLWDSSENDFMYRLVLMSLVLDLSRLLYEVHSDSRRRARNKKKKQISIQGLMPASVVSG